MRDAEVGQASPVGCQQHVGRLEIAVHHSAAVRVVERIEQTQEDPARFVHTQWSLAQSHRQSWPVDQLHGEPGNTLALAVRPDLHDGGMVELFEQGDLAAKARHQFWLGRQSRRKEFHRQCRFALSCRAGAVHGSHPARADHLLHHHAVDFRADPASLGHEAGLADQGFKSGRVHLDVTPGTE